VQLIFSDGFLLLNFLTINCRRCKYTVNSFRAAVKVHAIKGANHPCVSSDVYLAIKCVLSLWGKMINVHYGVLSIPFIVSKFVIVKYFI
jgi:hypothetical protein